jgi:hypothetical protein
LLDVITVIPFDIIFEYGNVSRIARLSRIGRIQKLIKLSKLARLMKTIKVKSRMSKHLRELIKISVGLERIIMMVTTFIVMLHVTTCVW